VDINLIKMIGTTTLQNFDQQKLALEKIKQSDSEFDWQNLTLIK